MVVPHEEVDQDGEDLADVANDREGGGGDDSAQREGEVAHAEATQAGGHQRGNATHGPLLVGQRGHLPGHHCDGKHWQHRKCVLHQPQDH